MADVLSQQEIDSLLSEMSSGIVQVDDIIESARLQKGEIANYDFRRPNRISKNQVRTLHSIHENFAEVLSYYLVSKLQTVVSINIESIDQLFYSEFILSVSNPSCLYIFDIQGTDGSGIMEISPQLALTIVERLLGGSADIPRKPRYITAIEQSVLKGVVEHALSDLRNAWRSIADLKFTYSRLEPEADFLQIAPSSEIVIVISLNVNIGMNSYLMNLCFPTFALEDVLARLNRQQVTSVGVTSAERVKENTATMTQQIATTHLPVVAELGKAAITVGELFDLKVGDVIKLSAKINQEVEISIAGRRKLAGRPGTLDGKKAVRVTRQLTDNDLVEQDILFKGDTQR
ncbi:MAG TPA: flagellar motor switch protein FliM [Patescibacteria group bacterium]|nr:flagellar motor switch protein FliM [Patescibacteria group bacterium]